MTGCGDDLARQRWRTDGGNNDAFADARLLRYAEITGQPRPGIVSGPVPASEWKAGGG